MIGIQTKNLPVKEADNLGQVHATNAKYAVLSGLNSSIRHGIKLFAPNASPNW